MNSRETDNLNQDDLLDVLQGFVAEAMKYLRKHTDTSKIPTVQRFTFSQKQGRTKILGSDQPNWWQVSEYMKPVTQLDSYNVSKQACMKSNVLLSRHMQQANVYNHGFTFYVPHVPYQFLTECVVRENGFSYHKSTVLEVFESLMTFVAAASQIKACIVAPLDGVKIEKKSIKLDSSARVRRLTPSQVADLANRCPILGHFYGRAHTPWFLTILEIDYNCDVHWHDRQDKKPRMSSDYGKLRNTVNQEITLLRALLNRRNMAPTYVLDYRGWNSAISTGGVIHYLPWHRSTHLSLIEVDKQRANRYQRNRKRFLEIKNETSKRRIFSAMRRLSSALDGIYAADRLFNAVAGLEGLLVGSQTEVSHKLAERTALLIGSKVEDKKDIYKQMKTAYGLRSKVAHGNVLADDLYMGLGSKKQLKKKEIDEFNIINKLSGLCMKYLHMAIAKCINKGIVDFDWRRSIMSGLQVK